MTSDEKCNKKNTQNNRTIITCNAFCFIKFIAEIILVYTPII